MSLHGIAEKVISVSGDLGAEHGYTAACDALPLHLGFNFTAKRTHQSSTQAPQVQLVMTSSTAAAAVSFADMPSRPRAGAPSEKR